MIYFGKKLLRRRIGRLLRVAIFLTDALFDFVVDLSKLFGSDRPVADQLIRPALQWIEFFERSDFFGAAIKFMIVGAGVAGEPFHLDPEKKRAASSANFRKRFGRRIVNLLHIVPINASPVIGFQNIERERVVFPGRHADAVAVVFDKKKHG